MARDIFLNLPNAISISRIVILFAIVFMVIYGGLDMILIASALTLVVILLDWLDGFAARKYNAATKFGGTLDIAADRIVENVFWVLLMYMGMVPIWIPLIFITRGFLVDAFRAHVKRPGWSVIHSPIGSMIVSSRFSRGISALSKAAAFISSFWLYCLKASIDGGQLLEFQSLMPLLGSLQISIVWFAAVVNVIRGIVTISDSLRFIER